MKFSKFIKDNRKKFGYSQEDLSKKLNVSRATIARWENESLIPSIEYVAKLADFFDTDEKEITKMINALKNKDNSKYDWQYIVLTVLTFCTTIVFSVVSFLSMFFTSKKIYNGFFYYNELYAFSVFDCSNLFGKLIIFLIPLTNIILFIFLTIRAHNLNKTVGLKIALLTSNLIYIIAFSLLLYFAISNLPNMVI